MLACVAFQQGACQVHVGPRRQDSAQRLLGLQPDLKLGHGRTAGNTTVSMGSVSGVRDARTGSYRWIGGEVESGDEAVELDGLHGGGRALSPLVVHMH